MGISIRPDRRRRGSYGRQPLLVALAAGAIALLAVSPAASAAKKPKNEQLPVLFVHGFESAGVNWASQEMRFESNGYKPGWLEAIDYDSTAATASKSEVDKQIEEAIERLKQHSGKSQVDVIAHSEGTTVMYDYLTEGEAASAHKASVAKYTNVDGQEENPGVPTLALWAGRCGDTTCSKPERHMEGAENVTIPDATHVQTSTSPESFRAIYKFFRGSSPKHDIVPMKGKIQLAGKALEFPVNTGAVGDTVQIWPLASDGARSSATPLASIPITDGSTGGGAWGPVTAKAGQRYEFALEEVGGKTLHVYYEPFVRNDYDIRLLASTPLQAYASRPGSSGAVIIRFKEFWGNQPGEDDEVLVNGLNICTASLCPWEKEVNAYFAYNREDKEESTLTEDPVLGNIPFLQGGDVYVRASSPPDETVAYQLKSRTGGPLRTLDVPNWESTTDPVEIIWNDFDTVND